MLNLGTIELKNGAVWNGGKLVQSGKLKIDKTSSLIVDVSNRAGFDVFESPQFSAVTRNNQIPGDETIDAAIEWLRQVDGSFFLWVHLFDPHWPYAPPAPYDETFSTDPQLREFMAERKIPAGFARLSNLYDGDLEWLDGDRLVGLPDMEWDPKYDYEPDLGGQRGLRFR